MRPENFSAVASELRDKAYSIRPKNTTFTAKTVPEGTMRKKIQPECLFIR